MEQTPFDLNDMNRIMTVITNLIHNDQYEMRTEFQRRRKMLKFDAEDHQLVATFYQLKPRKTEVNEHTITSLLSSQNMHPFRFIQQN